MSNEPTIISITTAVPLPEKVTENLINQLKTKLKVNSIQLESKVDPEVIGGVKLIINSVEYDSTIQGKLERLRTQLKATI
jgi:F-type H+-transporting ATPase subunit delta